MFHWQKEMTGLGIPARNILKVFRSLSDVQVGLPGFPSQLASAFVVSFAAGNGIRTAVALHLSTSRSTALYLHDRADVPPGEAEAVFEEGIRFAESMGFMVGDLDWQLLDASGRENLWASLPLGRSVRPAPPSRETDRPVRPAPVAPAASSAPEPPPPPPRKKYAPSPNLEARRVRLLETIGRFLASL
jgi:hypothetical protein